MHGDRLALLFPGQGAQTAEMRATVETSCPDLLERAIALLGEDPFPRVGESTRFAQPAIYCASIAGWQRVRGAQVDVCAGHSLGELAALVAGGALDVHQGLEVAITRGAPMDAATREGGEGAMVAVLGGPDADAQALARRFELVVANDNAPGQLVLSGPATTVEQAALAARAQGLRAVRLSVAGAFHVPAMEDARRRFVAALAGVRFRAPRVPVLSGVTAAPFRDPVRELADALTHPVRWRQTVTALHDRFGVRRVLDAGPGAVVARLVERTRPEIALQRPEDLELARA